MNSLSSDQAEQLKEIGAYLRNHRQQQSISTEEVAAKTFIPSRLLKALEEGQSDQLPEPVFVQGFIRRYAEALNLDGTALARTFPANLLPVKTDTSSQDAPESVSSEQFAIFNEEIGQKCGLLLESFSKNLSRVGQPYILYILLMLVASSGLLYLVNKPQTAKPTPQKKSSPIVQKPKTVAKAKPTPSPLKPTTSSQLSSPLQVAVNLKDESWLRVKIDGKTEFEGILKKGEKQTWTAKKQLTIRTGNAGGVLVSFNQKEAKALGNMGEVKEMTFTPDN